MKTKKNKLCMIYLIFKSDTLLNLSIFFLSSLCILYLNNIRKFVVPKKIKNKS